MQDSRHLHLALVIAPGTKIAALKLDVCVVLGIAAACTRVLVCVSECSSVYW